MLLLPVNSGRGAAFRAVGESLRQPVLGSGHLFASLHGHPGPARDAPEERALPIVHDEFRRPFLEGLLASIALLRFAGHDQNKLLPDRAERFIIIR